MKKYFVIRDPHVNRTFGEPKVT